jgi:AcrR family transcriptional regulator
VSRPPLTPARVIDAASRVADATGLAGVSMRSVGRELGVEAMSLYHHVANKDALLDGLADWVFAQILTPTLGVPWRSEMEARARSARTVLAAHPWGLGLVESRRSAGPATLRHHDAVLGCLRTDGFTVALAAHAFSVLDAYTFGFVLTEVNLPFEPGTADEFIEEIAASLADRPWMTELVAERITGQDYAYGDEFEYGLALVLDGIEAAYDAEVTRRS